MSNTDTATHPADCQYCAAGEPSEHTYEPPTDTVEIPADVRDNSETVTDYAFMRHLSTHLKPPTPASRDKDLELADLFGYTHYQWHGTAQGTRDGWGAGQRYRVDLVVNRDGEVVNHFLTMYWTRVACYLGDWCGSYAAHYATTTGGTLPVSDPVPVCDHHIEGLRKSFADSPVTVHLSERLFIGQHD
jgi:hypothetical protein